MQISVLGYLTTDKWVIGNCGDYKIHNYKQFPKYTQGWFLLTPFEDKWWCLLYVQKL